MRCEANVQRRRSLRVAVAWTSTLACAVVGWTAFAAVDRDDSASAIERFEAAENLADRAVGPRREAMRRETLRALAEAIRLDESLGASAVRLALEVEDDAERRSHLLRLAQGLDRRGGVAIVDAATAVEASRFLAQVRRGDRREAKRLFDRPDVRRVLMGAIEIDRAGGSGSLPDFEAWLASSSVVSLDDAERRATLELELALLDPQAAGLGLGLRLDGGRPLSEVDARGLAEWFESAGR